MNPALLIDILDEDFDSPSGLGRGCEVNRISEEFHNGVAEIGEHAEAIAARRRAGDSKAGIGVHPRYLADAVLYRNGSPFRGCAGARQGGGPNARGAEEPAHL